MTGPDPTPEARERLLNQRWGRPSPMPHDVWAIPDLTTQEADDFMDALKTPPTRGGVVLREAADEVDAGGLLGAVTTAGTLRPGAVSSWLRGRAEYLDSLPREELTLTVDGIVHSVSELREGARVIADQRPGLGEAAWSYEMHLAHGLAITLEVALRELEVRHDRDAGGGEAEPE